MWKLALFTTILFFGLSLASSVKRNDYETSEMTSTTEADDDQEMDEKMDIVAIMKECNETFPIEMSYLQQLNDSGSFPDENDETPKCYIRCLLEKQGVLPDGDIDTTRAAMLYATGEDLAAVTLALEISTMCSDRRETSLCEKAYNFMKCYMETKIDDDKKRFRS